MLKHLHLKDVGPFRDIELDPAPRLNLLTGDNGLGKTFVLDAIWRVLTGADVGPSLLPFRALARERIAGPGSAPPPLPVIAWGEVPPPPWWAEPTVQDFALEYNRSEQQWWADPLRGAGPSPLVVYARVDGGFAIFDPSLGETGRTVLTPEEVWHGKTLRGPNGPERRVCAGLIDDWVDWQRSSGHSIGFLHAILERLSEPEAPLRIGEPGRVRLDDRRDIPMLETELGEVPVTLASAAVKRIVSLAYILIWAWAEHTVANTAIGNHPSRDIVLLVDEVEQHLHPRWQRHVLPALLDAAASLMQRANIQLFASTHSPLVAASVEPVFDEEQDDLVHFERDGTVISAREIPFAMQGDADLWLASDAFGLRYPRSAPSEAAIRAATAFMRGDRDEALRQVARAESGLAASPEVSDLQARIHRSLLRLVAPHDAFWPRWIVTAKDFIPR
jgi:hypothetical protein